VPVVLHRATEKVDPIAAELVAESSINTENPELSSSTLELGESCDLVLQELSLLGSSGIDFSGGMARRVTEVDGNRSIWPLFLGDD
jgi:hypothetical protein